MRMHPGMTIVVPVDYEQTRAALHATWDLDGPVYYRIGKDSTTLIPGLSGRFAIGSVQTVRDGADVLILALGTTAIEATNAARVLAERGIDSAVGIVSCVNPPPDAELAPLLARFPLAITVEAHYIVGGIGSLVAEIIAEHGLACRLVRCGITHTPDGITGSRDYLHHVNGLSCEALVAVAVRELGRDAR
jgi:transketolase